MEAFSNQEQMMLFLQSILFGVGVGIFYDLLRAPRRVFGFGWGATALCDAAFWLVVLAALFEFNLLFAAGQNRYFVLTGAGIGAGIYFGLLSGVVLAVFEWLLRVVTGIVTALYRAAAYIAQRVRRSAPAGRVIIFAKKFAQPSSIFRRKGIK